MIKIGRGHDNDLRIADISVSRCHAFIKKNSKGEVALEDNTSKFGTLVQVKAPLIFTENLVYYFQAGRTIIKAQVVTEWSILNSFMKTSSDKKEEESKHLQIRNSITGDAFFDCIGKYCNQYAIDK